MVAYRNASGQGLGILRIDADGGVQVRSPSESARGDYGIYDLNSRIITLIGSVSLNRGDTQVRGQRLVMDLNTGRSTLDGGNVASTDGGRVSGRFVVPQRSGDSSEEQPSALQSLMRISYAVFRLKKKNKCRD